MSGGQEITSAQGTAADSRFIRLQSRRTGGGAASFPLSGSGLTSAQGAFTKTASVSASGSAATSASGSVSSQTGVLGTLQNDGPATPEQISLFLPITGSVSLSATATCRYRLQGSTPWTTGHPLHRIRPDLAQDPTIVDAGFAWPIIDLQAGSTYEVEVTVIADGQTTVKTLTHTTRALPAAAGAVNKAVNAGMSQSAIQAVLDGLVAGDVLEFANGTYTLASQLQITTHGSDNNPYYIRGASRAGVVISLSDGMVWQVLDAGNCVLENMTVEGSGVDSGIASSSTGVVFWNGVSPDNVQTRLTFRNLTINGVDGGIAGVNHPEGILVYNCTLNGNNTWVAANLDSNLAWNDVGFVLKGKGNCMFNNTLNGFGDTLKLQSGVSKNYGVYFYRNEVRNSCDDGMEFDGARRNCAGYDNRIHNSMTLLSLDPCDGGPVLCARNISVNTGRQPFKFNDKNTGHFIYNNTVIRTTGQPWVLGSPTAEAGWLLNYIGSGNPQEAWGYQNNVLIYQGPSTQVIRLDNTGYTLLDWDHNAWYPDGHFKWLQAYDFASLADAKSGSPTTTPVFGTSTKWHVADVITSSSPWTADITLGANYRTEITNTYTPALAVGATPKNSGTAIQNITDGYSGAAPDMGALIGGRSTPVYGDRSNLQSWVPSQGQIANISLNTMSAVDPEDDPAVNPLYPANARWHGTDGQQGLFAYGGSTAYIPDVGTWGKLACWGGGDNDYYGNEPYSFDFDTRLWVCHHAPVYGTLADDALIDASWGEYNGLQTQPGAPHTYRGTFGLSPSLGGGSAGSLVQVYMTNIGGALKRRGSYKFTFSGSSGSWARYANGLFPVAAGAGLGPAAFDKTHGYFYVISSADAGWSTSFYVLNTSTLNWSTVGATPPAAQLSPALMEYCPDLDCVVLIETALGGASLANPAVWTIDAAALRAGTASSWVNRTTNSLPGALAHSEISINWAGFLGKFALYNGLGEYVVYYLDPPAVISATWTWSKETFSGATPEDASAGNPASGFARLYSRFLPIDALSCFAWVSRINGPVQLWRPTDS